MYHAVRGEYIWLRTTPTALIMFIFIPKATITFYGFYLLANHVLWPGVAIITLSYLAKFIYCMHTALVSKIDKRPYIFPEVK